MHVLIKVHCGIAPAYSKSATLQSLAGCFVQDCGGEKLWADAMAPPFRTSEIGPAAGGMPPVARAHPRPGSGGNGPGGCRSDCCSTTPRQKTRTSPFPCTGCPNPVIPLAEQERLSRVDFCRSRFARPVIPMSFKLFRRGPMRFAFRISLSWRSNRRSSQRITVSSSADLDGDGCRRGIRPGFYWRLRYNFRSPLENGNPPLVAG